MRPKSSSPTFICRKSMARTVPSVIGTSYVRPVRLSVTVRVSAAWATPLPSRPSWGCSLMRASLGAGGLPLAPAAPEQAAHRAGAHVGRELAPAALGVALGQLRRGGRVERQRHAAL